MHRIKIMTDQELFSFKLFSVSKIVFNSFGRTAIFIGSTTTGAGRAVLLCGQHVRYLENLYPGGWVDCRDASDRRWQLMAGTSSACENFGIEEDVVDNSPEAAVASNVYHIKRFDRDERGRDQRDTRQYNYSHW